MTIKKTLVMMSAIFFLGTVFVLAAENPMIQSQQQLLQRAGTRVQNRILFVDENGDGICDFARDHDNDGIPNGQDPDWVRPQDGTGFMNKKGNSSISNQMRNGSGNSSGKAWGRQDFGQNRGSFGNGVCDGSGPRGKSGRNGRG